MELTGRLRGDQQTAEQSLGRGFIELPDQALARRISGEQPVTGGPHSRGVEVATFLPLHFQFGVAAESQLDQRLAVKAEAQAVFGFIGYKTTA
ncbi:hypothetical protein D3C84_818990 [compost metagenome]